MYSEKRLWGIWSCEKKYLSLLEIRNMVGRDGSGPVRSASHKRGGLRRD